MNIKSEILKIVQIHHQCNFKIELKLVLEHLQNKNVHLLDCFNYQQICFENKAV